MVLDVIRAGSRCWGLAVLALAGELPSLPASAQPLGGARFELCAFGTRRVPSAAVALYDSRREQLLLVSGQVIDSTGAVRQTGTVLGIPGIPGRNWAPRFEPTGDIPLRSGAGAVYDSVSDRVLLWGGARVFPSGLVPPFDADLFRLDPGQAEWSREPAAGRAPPPRRAHGMVLDAARRRLIVFGGQDIFEQFFGDVWVRGVDGGATWDSLETQGPRPQARSDAAVVYDAARDRLLVLGGIGFGPVRFSDAWSLDLTTQPPTWSLLPMSSGRLEGVASAAVDRARDRAVLVNGDGMNAFEWSFARNAVAACPGTPPGRRRPVIRPPNRWSCTTRRRPP